MSSSAEMLQLQLGDIIQVESPTNDKMNDQIFLITYIDQSQIEVQNIDSLAKTTLLLDSDGELTDDTIDSISLLSRDKEEGYARQHGLLPKTWVTITLGGDLPAIFTGQITNLEEDMIEVSTYPEKDTIYIDFAYKGIPKDIPIKSIEIRDPPDLDITTTETPPEPEGSGSDVPVPQVKQQIQQFIIQADDIKFGPDLGEITQEVQVGESMERYGIQTQTNDLLDELLATVPNAERTRRVLNNIHLIIERYKELRNAFSEKDEYGNPTNPITKGASYKPLVSTLHNLNRKLAWILPVVKNKKKVYDVDEADAEEVDDIVNMTMAESQIQETDAYEKYTTNAIPDSQNKYDYLLKEIHNYGTPYEAPDGDSDDFITRQQVEANLNVLVDNLDEFYSSVVVKENLTRKRYLMTKYNLGLTQLKTVVEPGSKPYHKMMMATPNNKVYLKSLILLPEEAVRFSRVDLPGSSILLKAVLNKQGFDYYKRFSKDASINTDIIESFETPVQHSFLQSATEIVLDDSLQSEDNKYERYLQSIVPKTKSLFEIMKKYIDEKLTLSEVVKELEPFMIYSDDLTYKQYREMTSFIKNKVNDYKKGFVSKNRDFRSLISGKKFADKTWYSLFNILQGEKKEIMEQFYGLQMRGFSSSENYAKIMNLDCGRLFMTAIAVENIMLMTHLDINDMFERDRLKIQDEIREPKPGEDPARKTCADVRIVKRYLELDELLDDNNKTIYVDKNLDTTQYDIVDEYHDERDTMEPSEFKQFLVEKLIANIGLSRDVAERDAEAMISGKRTVEDGQYASLEIDGGEKTYYYKRNGQQWERDETIPEVKMDESMFCNIKNECASVDNECESTGGAEQQTEEASLSNLIKEFNIKYEVSKDEMTRIIENRLIYLKYRIGIIKKLNIDHRYKYNDEHLKLGIPDRETEPVAVSPYAKLRDAILGQPDFVKRNNDIVRFYTMFLRDAIEDKDESPYWYYCRETNLKVLPVFIYTLANTFIQDQYNYVKVMDRICANQGKLSDDGNAWVDEHSGYVIKTVEFNTEEGYDESGFKSLSRDLLQDDLRTLRGAEMESKYSDPNAIKISNVVQSMASYMGFSAESMEEFIIRNTLLITARIVPSETEYNKKRDLAAKKGKKVPEYIDAFNTSMLLVTFIYLLVGIQTAVPSIRTKKQFPGCKKSFEGFPLDGSGDDSGITYIACVANKIKSGVAPWNTLKKMNMTGIAKRMKDLINKFVVPESSMQTLFNEKRAYLLEAHDDDIPGELDIAQWQTFLPPLRPIATVPREEISEEFKSGLIANIRAGKSAQQSQLNAIVANMIHYPMVMIEEIQKVVSKEVPILTNISDEAFLENACCIDEEELTTVEYFMKRIPALAKYNAFVKQLHSIYNDIQEITLAPRIYSPNNTRRIYPALSSSFGIKTIYRAIIHYCKFGTAFPIPEKLQVVCLSKPEEFSLLDSLSKQIKSLESEGKNYTLEDLQRLLYIVNRENIISVSLYDDEKSALEHFRDYLNEDVVAIPAELHAILKDLVDTFELNVATPTSEMKKAY